VVSIGISPEGVRNGKMVEWSNGEPDPALLGVGQTMTRRANSLIGIISFCLAAFGPGLPRASIAEQERAVLSAVQFLKGHSAGRSAGETAMIALALLKAEVPPADPVLAACIAKLRTRFSSSDYQPELHAGPGTYEAGVTAMVFANLDASLNRSLIELIATYLRGRQNGNGSWDYNDRTQGDTSISQYAVLGLWEAENAGVDVSPSVWDRAAAWYMSTQSGGGSWNYHRDGQYPETLSMTAAGVGSLMICRRQLDRHRQQKRGTNPLLLTLVPESQHESYHPSTSSTQIDQAITRGLAWIAANFAPGNTAITGQSANYGLYGIERIGALGDRQTIGRVDWFAKGRDFLHATQGADGSWPGAHGTEMNTVWGVLFLTKSTAKTIRRITLQPKLGAGTLLGGRDLPKDLTSMTVAGGRVVSRPMNGAIEGMLAVLEDPRAEQGDAAVAGMVERYYAQGAGALRPFKVRFRKMLFDRDPGVRRVAAWALAHTGDLDVVPVLLDTMVVANEDEDVVTAIRLGLQLLSRKIDGMGPPTPSSPDERLAAARKWREWYQAIKPLDLEGQDDDFVRTDGPTTPVRPADSGSSPR
jgi:hypothetical protein